MERAEHPVGRLDERDGSASHVESGKSLRNTLSNSSRRPPAISTPVGPPPTTTTPSIDRVGRRAGAGALEPAEQDGRAGAARRAGTSAGRRARRRRRRRTRADRAGGDDEVVVVEQPVVADRHGAAVEVDSGDLAEPKRIDGCAARKMPPDGKAMSSASRPAVATWYSSGWKVWKLLASTSVTSTSDPARPLAARIPPNPEPMMTTRAGDHRRQASDRPTCRESRKRSADLWRTSA